jgi:hypothetical protein
MPRGLPCLLLVLALPTVGRIAAAQGVATPAPGGTLTGVVRDSATGRPVGYALVVLLERDQRVFASEAGKFALTGLLSGRATLRVQQIGYRALTLVLNVDADPGVLSGAPALVLTLARQPVVLPEIRVQGAVCTGTIQLAGSLEPEGLEEIFKNADRLVTLQRDYPFRETYEELRTVYGPAGEMLEGRVDTSRYDSRSTYRYRPGAVIDRGRNREESASYFQVSDLALDPFRKTHCFWYSGGDSLEGAQAYRFQFAPLKRVKSIDWAGSLWIDSSSMVLIRSEAHLVNLPPRGTSFEWASCTVLYQQIVPTLVTPSQARCVTRRKGEPPHTAVARWLLIDHNFIGRRPNTAETPP